MKDLDRRLSAIISEIDCDVLADIGCDHGYIGVQALIERRAKQLLAADISEKSLSKCRLLAAEKNLTDRVEFVVSDGFENVTTVPDTAVIAGMGGYEIIKILKSAKSLNRVPEKLILCPHQNASELRRFLNNYPIEKDYIVRSDKKFYPIIVVSAKGEKYRADEFRYGKNYPANSDYFDMLESRICTLEERFQGKKMPEKVLTEYKETKELLCRK